jgi:hypothetical protein
MGKGRSIAFAALLFASCAFSQAKAPDPADNGGSARLGVNLSEMTYYSTQLIFKDLCKTMVAVRVGTGFTQAQFDANGYPLFLSSGQSVNLSYGIDTGFAFPEGQYHVFFDGKGRIESVYNTASFSGEIGPGHQAWTVTHASDSQVGFRIAATDPADHLRNLRVILPGFADDYLRDPIHPAFRERWSILKAFRFMDWLAINGSPVSEWAQMTPSGYITQVGYSGEWGNQVFASDPRGASVGLAVELCNAMDADIWLCVPHRASDDLIRRMALLVRDRLDPNHKVYIEYSNEVWNWGFPQAEYCQEAGMALGLEGSVGFSVKRSGDVFSIWEDAWGAESGRVVNVWAWQNVDDYWTWVGLDSFSNQRANPSGRKPELYASAPYFTHGDGDPPPSMDELFRRALSGTGNYSLSLLDGLNRKRLERLAAYGIEMGCYEAGQHYASFGQRPELDDRLFVPANRDPRMGACYRKFLADWQNANPGGLMMLYDSCQTPGTWGSWGLLERWDQDPAQAPKYAAVRDFAQSHR